MADGCRFCGFLGAQDRDEPSAWDRPIWESDNFVAIPSLGPIVEGWLLVVPREHVVCLGALDEDLFTELIDFKNQVRGRLENRYGSVAQFEHGPAKEGLEVGCTVDHAHLHLVPTEVDLASGASEELAELRWLPAVSMHALKTCHEAGKSYLMVEQPPRVLRIATHDELPSQLFRKVLAKAEGCPDKYDWRVHPNPDLVYDTCRALDSAQVTAPLERFNG